MAQKENCCNLGYVPGGYLLESGFRAKGLVWKGEWNLQRGYGFGSGRKGVSGLRLRIWVQKERVIWIEAKDLGSEGKGYLDHGSMALGPE